MWKLKCKIRDGPLFLENGDGPFFYINKYKNGIDKSKIHAKIMLLKFKLIFSIKFKIKKIEIK